MKTASLLRKLAKFYPQKIRDSYDYGGLMAGRYKEETNRIYLALDFDKTLFEDVLAFKPDLIITHHPFFFGKPKEIMERSEERRECYDFLLKNNIPLASYHTNFDRGEEGMNDALARELGLSEIKRLEGDNMARGGKLPSPMSTKEFAKYVLDKLDVPHGLLIDKGNKTIKTAAIIGGGGWRSYAIAQAEGYDIFISGDCPHHARREIILSNYNYLDIPHEVEGIFIKQMTNILLKIDQSLVVGGYKHEIVPQIVLRDSK